jgi:GntR family transcriptional regulator, transcriptional repressor for pyruvate dehydrogenase complex
MDPQIFTPIAQMPAADQAVEQIELLLLDGVLSSGDRLPSERELAAQLDISRPVLRQALKELEHRGLLVSRHGEGTFIADLIGQVFSRPVAELVARHPRATGDYLEYRRMLEGEAASLAAERATAADKARLAGIVAAMHSLHEAGDFEAELAADVAFHNAVGDAAHNIVLMHTLRSCYRLLTEGIFFHRRMIFDRPGARERLVEQHAAIADAIGRGRPAEARQFPISGRPRPAPERHSFETGMTPCNRY